LPPREKTPGVQFVPWRREALAAFVPFGHALATRRQIDLRELAGEALVAVSSKAALPFRPTSASTVAKPGSARGSSWNLASQAVAVMVAAGTGIALLPASWREWSAMRCDRSDQKSTQRRTRLRPQRGPAFAAMRQFIDSLSAPSLDV